MKQIQFKDISVKVYTNAVEYTNDWFEMPKGAILDENSVPKSAGMADIEGKEIAIFTTKLCSFDDLLSTVAHELGHLVKNGFTKNPPQKPRYNKRHELKADHYESFAIDSYRLSHQIYGLTTAAPDMYEALEAFVSNVDKWLETGEPADPETSKAIYEKAKSAMLKAVI